MLRLALLLCLSPLVAGAQGCPGATAIRFAPGASSEEVAGLVPPDGMLCYDIGVGEGQQARIRILEGDNVVFGVEGLIDAQDDYAFVAERGTYRIRVMPLLRTATPKPFRMGVEIADGRVEAPGGWRTDEGEGHAGGLAWIGEEGGPSFALSCAAPEPRLTLTYDGLGTAALAQAPAEAAPAEIEIAVEGEARRHPVELVRYDGFDRYWEVTTGLDEPFLADFAAGSALRLLDAEGASAGEVGLAGSARLREAIARRCGL